MSKLETTLHFATTGEGQRVKTSFHFLFSQNSSSFTNPSDQQFGQRVGMLGEKIFYQNLDSSLRLAEYFKNEDALVGW